MTSRDFFLVTCEHGGNRVPPPYRYLFAGHEPLLHTHRAYDKGALRVARELAGALAAPLMVCTVSRLLIEMNRSPRHPRLYSEISRDAGSTIRAELFQRYYLPYRRAVESHIARVVANGGRIIHISSHSFTPELDGQVRNADVGLLYDPKREGEVLLCKRWRARLKLERPDLKVRMNYPYAGTADGFTVSLRRRFPAESYAGIELEINQKHAAASADHWRAVRAGVIGALRAELVRTPSEQKRIFPV